MMAICLNDFSHLPEKQQHHLDDLKNELAYAQVSLRS